MPAQAKRRGGFVVAHQISWASRPTVASGEHCCDASAGAPRTDGGLGRRFLVENEYRLTKSCPFGVGCHHECFARHHECFARASHSKVCGEAPYSAPAHAPLARMRRAAAADPTRMMMPTTTSTPAAAETSAPAAPPRRARQAAQVGLDMFEPGLDISWIKVVIYFKSKQ